jgi:hypothetical protein
METTLTTAADEPEERDEEGEDVELELIDRDELRRPTRHESAARDEKR